MLETKNEKIIKEINEILNQIRQFIQNDGGDVEFKSFENNVLVLEVSGHCIGCASFDMTYTFGIKDTLMSRIPEVKDVIFVPKKQVW